MWQKVSEFISGSNKLSLSRAQLDKVLESSTYTPQDLINLLERDLGMKFKADSGVHEKYSIKRHTLMVLGQFEKYFADQELPAGMGNNFFRIFLSLHDIGKPDAIRETGDRNSQHRYTVGIMHTLLNQLNFSDQEIRIAVTLVSGDVIGKYIKGHRNGKITTEELKTMADEAKLSFNDLLELMLIYYQVDAGSYTKDAGGLESLDYLFEFKPKEKRMVFSVDVAAKVDQLKIYAAAFPNTIWLDDHNWHDMPWDNLKAWVKINKDKLDSGKVIKGLTFCYRYDSSSGEYQIQVSHSIKEALYTKHSMLLLDYDWHDLVFDDLKEWVKESSEQLDSGEELDERMFRYRLNQKTKKYQVRLTSRVKEALYAP
ncbi:hypothetical protein ACFLTP_00970 [Chloroflexota bacterium]